MDKNTHVPVLLHESIDLLDIHPGDVYLDATLGAGGHAEEVWKRFGSEVTVTGIDADPQAVEMAQMRLELLGAHPKFFNLNFRNLKEIEVKPTKSLFDLGWNKHQFEAGERGFSFQKDEPLLMTFSSPETHVFTAYDIVNSWEAEHLETILDAYGEEQFARRIARAIVESRINGPIKTSGRLADIVKHAVPVWYRFKKIHPATKTFQALRIAVNDELQALSEGLEAAVSLLPKKGRIAVISFHSLEDRIVKHFFKKLEDLGTVDIITKKPVVASLEEIEANPRARSAKLRAVVKI